jgi:DNA modification methylase
MLYIGDCIDVMRTLPVGFADLIFADPPFNIGYQYDVYQDKRSKNSYLKWTAQWMEACMRVLSDHGSMVVAIGDEFAADLKLHMDKHLTMRNWIIWHYTFGVNCKNKFSRSHTHLLYYVRDPKNYTFNPMYVPSVRSKIGDKRAAAKGKMPDDTWAFPLDADTWKVSRVCGTFNEREDHPCQMPEAVLDRIIQAMTDPGDQVLDPFAGSGTTLAVAKKLGRDWVGIELSENYAKIIERRLASSPSVKK